MNKKDKKKMDTLKKRIQKLEQQLAGAKKQADEPEEISRLGDEIAKARAELEQLKSA